MKHYCRVNAEAIQRPEHTEVISSTILKFPSGPGPLAQARALAWLWRCPVAGACAGSQLAAHAHTGTFQSPLQLRIRMQLAKFKPGNPSPPQSPLHQSKAGLIGGQWSRIHLANPCAIRTAVSARPRWYQYAARGAVIFQRDRVVPSCRGSISNLPGAIDANVL